MLELARLSDQDAINTMALQVHAAHVNWRPDIYEAVPELYTRSRLEEAIRSRSLYVARIGGMALGYVLLKIRSIDLPGMVKRQVMYIEEFCVEETLRNQGIGSEMMAEVRVLAKAFGCTDLQLNVYPQNDEAVAFYQKCGFMIQSIVMQRNL